MCSKVDKFETLYSAAILSLMSYLDVHVKAKITPFADSLQNRGLEDVAADLFSIFNTLKKSVVEDKHYIYNRFFYLFESLASDNYGLQGQLLDEYRKYRDLAAELRALQQTHNYQTVKLTKLFQNSTFLNFVQSERKKQIQSSSIYQSDLFDSQFDEQIYRLQDYNMKVKESRAKLEEAIFLVESAFQTDFPTVDKQEMTMNAEDLEIPSCDLASAHRIELLEAELYRKRHEVQRLQKLMYTVIYKEIPGISANNAEKTSDEFVQVMNSIFEHVGVADRLERYATTGQFDYALQESIQAQIAQRFKPSQLSSFDKLGDGALGRFAEYQIGSLTAEKSAVRYQPGYQRLEPDRLYSKETLFSSKPEKHLSCHAATQTKQQPEREGKRCLEYQAIPPVKIVHAPAYSGVDALDDSKDQQNSSDYTDYYVLEQSKLRVKPRKKARRAKTVVLNDAMDQIPRKNATIAKITNVQSYMIEKQAENAKNKGNYGYAPPYKSPAADLRLRQRQNYTQHTSEPPVQAKFDIYSTSDAESRRLFPSPHEESTKPVESAVIHAVACMTDKSGHPEAKPLEAKIVAEQVQLSVLQEKTENYATESWYNVDPTVYGSYVRSKYLLIDYKNKIMKRKPLEYQLSRNSKERPSFANQLATEPKTNEYTQTDESFFAPFFKHQVYQHGSYAQVSTLRLQCRDNSVQTSEENLKTVNIAQTETGSVPDYDKSTITEAEAQEYRCIATSTQYACYRGELVIKQYFGATNKHVQVCTCDCMALSQTKIYLQHVLRQNNALEQVCCGLEDALSDERKYYEFRAKVQQILRNGKLEAQPKVARGEQQPLVKNEADILRKQVMLEFASRYNANK